jgi:phage terminase large subunit-like protein
MSARVSPGVRLASVLADLTAEQRRAVLASLDPRDVEAMRDDVTMWLRDEQVWQSETAPTITAYLAGRGWGKTLTGAAAVDYVAAHPELCGGRGYGDRPGEGGVIGIAGRTFGDVMETMLHGPSGLLSAVPLARRPTLLISRKRLEWPNGVVGRLMTGDEPDSFRGPNFGFLWADEIAHWQRARESWDNAMFGLRHGHRPRAVITTTPLGTPVLASILYETDEGGVPRTGSDGLPLVRDDVQIVRGSTYDNLANLGETYRGIIARYEGTRLGLQELHGQLLLDNPDALIRRDWLRRVEDHPPLSDLRVIVAVDPAVTSGEGSAESGVVVVGQHRGTKRIYLLADLSGKLTPMDMDATVASACERWGAREIVVEDNNGGDYLEAALVRAKQAASVRRVKATKSKRDRWALVAGDWERGLVFHAGPPRQWVTVEHQLCDTDPNKGGRSDRGDAVTWAVIYLTSEAADLSRQWRAGTLTEAMRGLRR